MTDMFLERIFSPPITTETVLEMAREGAGCFSLHRVTWHGSLISSDGDRLLCWFSGRDTESQRTALRQVGADISLAWSGTVHDAPHGVDGWTTGIIVTRRYDASMSPEAILAIEDVGASSLQAHGVRFLRALLSRDRRRTLCLYQAPDAETLRSALHVARMPIEDIWSYRLIPPSSITPAGTSVI